MIGPQKNRLYIDREGLSLKLLGPIDYGVVMCLKVRYRSGGFLMLLFLELPLRFIFGRMAPDHRKQEKQRDHSQFAFQSLPAFKHS